ncbi:MAG: hypothetical protein LBV71_08350 [Prevotella sp.]|jgi:hypothetical protein|nr:hypothetical protein [Prevotella sp.]
MEKELAAYRLDDRKEINPYLREPVRDEFFIFLNGAYKMLMSLHPGEQIVIEDDVCPENRERFIKVSCMFIMENNPDYEFTNDYTAIKRLLENPVIRIPQILRQIKTKRRQLNELERTSRAG